MARPGALKQYWASANGLFELDRTLICNQRHLLQVLRDYEAHHNDHGPHRSFDQTAPHTPLPAAVMDCAHLRVHWDERAGGTIGEYTVAA